jgi:hypothetical protein
MEACLAFVERDKYLQYQSCILEYKLIFGELVMPSSIEQFFRNPLVQPFFPLWGTGVNDTEAVRIE